MSPLALFALLLTGAADAAERTFVYDITLGSQTIGQRTVVVDEPETPDALRQVRVHTEVEASVGPVSLTWRQRVTGYAVDNPASFHAVHDENGTPREVQARWTPSGWTITVATPRRQVTREASIDAVDVSTLDLMDPASHWPLSRFQQVSVLSAETGEVYTGDVRSLGADTVQVGGRTLDVSGYEWASPQGTHAFWYDNDGVLVRYRTRIAGRPVMGTLTAVPTAGIDAFSVGTGRNTDVDAQEL